MVRGKDAVEFFVCTLYKVKEQLFNIKKIIPILTSNYYYMTNQNVVIMLHIVKYVTQKV